MVTDPDIWAIDLFAGAGPMALGFKQAGVKIALAIEQDPVAAASYQKNFPGTPIYQGSVGSFLPWTDLPNLRGKIDLVFGGPPCQVFSIAGKRVGCLNPRNAIPFYLEVIDKVRPLALCLENVFGIITKKNFPYLLEIKRGLVELGYTLTDGILRADQFGVPQNRPRYFLLGIEADNPISLPSPTHGVGGLFPRVLPRDVLPWWDEGIRLGEPTSVKYGANPDIKDTFYNSLFFSSNRIFVLNPDKASPTLMTSSHVAPVIAESGGLYEYWKRLKRGANVRSGVVRNARHLSIEEAKRIQGLPDNFYLLGEDADQWQQLGNSVVPAVAEAVAKEIIKAIKPLRRKKSRKPEPSLDSYVAAKEVLEQYVSAENFSEDLLDDVEIISVSFAPTPGYETALIKKVAERAMKENHREILMALASNYFVTPPVIEIVATDAAIEVRSAIAGNSGLVKFEGQVSNTIVGWILELSTDPSSQVLQALASNVALMGREDWWVVRVIGNCLAHESIHVTRNLAANIWMPKVWARWPEANVWPELIRIALVNWRTKPVAEALAGNIGLASEAAQGNHVPLDTVADDLVEQLVTGGKARRQILTAFVSNPAFCYAYFLDYIFGRVGALALKQGVAKRTDFQSPQTAYFLTNIELLTSEELPESPSVIKTALANPCLGYDAVAFGQSELAAEFKIWRKIICTYFWYFTIGQQNAIVQNGAFVNELHLIPEKFYAYESKRAMVVRSLMATNPRVWTNEEMFYWLADPEIQPVHIRCELAAANYEVRHSHEVSPLVGPGGTLVKTLVQDPSPRVQEVLANNPTLESIRYSQLDYVPKEQGQDY